MSDSRTDAKFEALQADVTEIKVVMATNTAHLQEHMRRTDLLEKRLEGLPARALLYLSLLSGLLTAAKLLGLVG